MEIVTNILEYVYVNERITTAVIYLITTLFVGMTAWFTRKIANTTLKSFTESRRPEIIVYLEPGKYHIQLLEFSIENVGNGAARNVRAIIDVNEEEFKKREIRIGKQVPSNSPIEILSSKSKRTTFFGSCFDGCLSMDPIDVVVRYEDLRGKKYKEKFRLNPSEFEGLSPPHLAENETAESLKKIEEHTKRLSHCVRSGHIKVETITTKEMQNIIKERLKKTK